MFRKNPTQRLMLEALEERIFFDANPLLAAAEMPVEPLPVDLPGASEPTNAAVATPESSVIETVAAIQPAPLQENMQQPAVASSAISVEGQASAGIPAAGGVATETGQISEVAGTVGLTPVTSADGTPTIDLDTFSQPAPVLQTDVASTTVEPAGQLVFIDDSVKAHETLVNGVVADIDRTGTNSTTTVIVLDSSRDEIQQITDTLAQYSDLSGVHIVSHGNNGSLSLGNITLDENSLSAYSSQLQQWGKALNENGDLLLYGCTIAQDGRGVEFIESLAHLTGADVAASNDATGNTQWGGNWDLEISTGVIDVHSIQDASGHWDGLLAPPDPISGASVTDARPMLNSSIGFSVTFDNDLAPSNDALEGYGPYIDVLVPKAVQVTGGPTVFGSPATHQVFTWNGASWTGVTTHPFDSGGVILTKPTGTAVGDKWYLVELPFGSFVPNQPVASVDFTADISTANGAAAEQALTIVSKAGFRYGDTATNDNGPIAEAGTHTTTITPRVLDIEKTNNAPEGQTATGPNYPVTYTLTVNVAAGETVSNVVVSDYLPQNAVYRGDVAVTAVNGATAVVPVITEPLDFTVLGATAGTRLLNINLGSITGVASSAGGTSEYQITYTVYYSNVDSAGQPLLNASTGDDRTVMNEASIAGIYNGNPISDGQDSPLGTLNDDPSDAITASDNQLEIDSIVVYKTATDLNGGAGTLPGDVIEWRLEVDVSDYFGVDNIVLNDVFGDGQTFIDGVNAAHALQLVPTLEIWENGLHTAAVAFAAANYTVGVEDALDASGNTALQFRVSDQLVTLGQDRFLDGGFFADGTVVGADASSDPLNGRIGGDGTHFFIVYRTVVDQNYDKLHLTAGYSGDASVDIGDTISNSVSVSADIVVDSTDHVLTGFSESDSSAASTTVPDGTVYKTIYAVNGNTSYTLSNGVSSGDRITYRLHMDLPTADFENLVITDFLPLPAYAASDLASSTAIDFNGVITYEGGEVEFGPDHNLNSTLIPGLKHNGAAVGASSLAPTWSIDSANNSITFDFGSYDTDISSNHAVIDILLTIVIQNNPMVDELQLTNQGQWSVNDTNISPNDQVAIIPITLNEPEVFIVKGVVQTDNTNSVLGGALGPAELTFNADGTISIAGGNTVDAQDLIDHPVDANLTNADGSDLVTFALTIYNTGGGDAFDIQVKDTLPSGFVAPASLAALNMHVYTGAGTALLEGVDYTVAGGDFFTNGLTFDNIALGGNPADRGHDNGNDTFIITYQLQTSATAPVNSSQLNTATIDFYTGIDDGATDWTEKFGEPTDVATVTLAAPTIAKTLLSTEIVNGTDYNHAVIGEVATYQVIITLPEGSTPAAQLVDTLDSGLTFIGLTAAVASNNTDIKTSIGDQAINTTNVTASAAGQVVTFNLGDLTNTNTANGTAETITLTYTVFVNNTAGNQNGTFLDNSARLTFTGGQSNTIDAPDIIVIEPDLHVTKTVVVDSSGTSGDAGDSVLYTITIQHSGSSQADAYDATFSDQIPDEITGATITGVTDTDSILNAGNFNLIGNSLSLTGEIDIALGRVITITVSGSLAAGVTPSQSIDNEATVTWESLNTGHTQNGTTNERTSSGDVVNNYTHTGNAILTIDPVTVAKQLISTEIVNASNSNSQAVIGEVATYQVIITLPEGSTPAAQLVDTLDSGLTFIGLTGAVASTTDIITSIGDHAINTTNVTTSVAGRVVTFNLGNLTNINTANGTAETITLTYTVFVNNTAGNQSGTLLDNSARLTFTGGQSNTIDAPDIIVIEPDLHVTKTVVVDSSGTSGDAGDSVLYTITIQHSGSSQADAYDATFSDQIPDEITGATIDSVMDTDSILNAGNFTLNGSNLLALTGEIDIALGRVITITVSGSLAAGVTPSQPIDNEATVTWESLDSVHTQNGTTNERKGSGGVNNYTHTGNAILTIDPVTVEKHLIATEIEDASNTRFQAVIGELATYEVTITLPEGVMNGARLVDTLDAGLDFVALTQVSTSAGDLASSIPLDLTIPTVEAGSSATGQTVTFTLGNLTNGITNDAPETITLRYTVLVTNDIVNTNGLLRDNSARFVWDNGNSASADAEDITIIEPIITTVKTINGLADGATSTVKVGDIVQYTVVLSNTGSATAYEVTAVDTLAQGTTYFTDGTHTPAASAGGLVITDNGTTIAITSGADGWDIAPGGSVTLTYYARVGAAYFDRTYGIAAGRTTNTVDADWSSNDNTASLTASGVDRIYDDGATPPLQTVDGGQDDDTAAFAVLYNASIGDRVFFDADGDGLPQEAGEVGITGITVTLTADLDNDGTVEFTRTTVTNAAGDYSFTNLAAFNSYVVTVTSAPLTAWGYSQTYDLDGTGTAHVASGIALAAGQNRTDVDFGYVGQNAVGDRVWFDANNDGVQDAGEDGIGGLTVTLSADIDGDGNYEYIASDITDGDGIYGFSRLPAGAYTITVTPPASSDPTYDFDGTTVSPNNSTAFTLAAVENRTNIDFGIRGTGSIADTVFFDTDADGGVQGTGVDIGISGVTVTLSGDIDNDGTIDYTATDITDADGHYAFTDLLAGTYSVAVTSAPLTALGYSPTYDLDDTTTAHVASGIALAAGQNRTDVDFGYTGQNTVGDRVWFDADGDGVQDAGEDGIGGLPVTLTADFDGDGTYEYTATDVTDGSGIYGFDHLPAGAYTITVSPPAASDPTYDLDGTTVSPNNTTPFTLGADEDRSDIDFGLRGTGSIADTVFFDTDADGGVQGTGVDIGISGVTVTLSGDIDNDGTIDYTATDITDADGHYAFTDLLAGTYSVTVTSAPLTALGYSPTYDLDDTTTAHVASGIALAAGQNRTDVDFGYTGQNTVGDRVWFDADNDGVQDAGEDGIGGLTVTLTADFDGDGTYEYTATDVTDGNGIYGFDLLPAGAYTITVTPPASSDPTYDFDGTTVSPNNTTPFTLGADEDRSDIDFGIRGTGSIADTVFFDTDADGGVQGTSVDIGISGVTVTLSGDIDGDGTIDYTATDITDADGHYAFTGLLAGTYSVAVTSAPLTASGYSPTYDLNGTVTPHVASGIALAAGQARTDVDFGYTGQNAVGDRVWFDADGDGVQDAGEVGIKNLTVTLGADFDGDGTYEYTATDITDGNGIYGFDHLPAGAYTITVSPPAASDPTYDFDGTTVSPDNSTPFTLGAAENRTNIDFGIRGTGSIGDLVFFDDNLNHAWDAGEVGIGGVDVLLSGDIDRDGTFEYTATVTTDAIGGYSFDYLLAGDYRVNVIQASLPAGYSPSADPDGGVPDGQSQIVTLAGGASDLTLDFGFASVGSIGDRIWYDYNDNGVQDAGEVGIGEVTVTLTGNLDNDPDIETLSTTTDSEGNYLFINLPPGVFTITVDPTTLPAGMEQTYDLDGISTLHVAVVTLPIGTNVTTVDFGYTGTGSIGDQLWIDATAMAA